MIVKYKCKFNPTGEVVEREIEVENLRELYEKLNEWNRDGQERYTKKKWTYWY